MRDPLAWLSALLKGWMRSVNLRYGILIEPVRPTTITPTIKPATDLNMSLCLIVERGRYQVIPTVPPG
jgi:hypothetical protein